MGKKHRAVWKVGPLCLFWSVWKARNRVAFEDGALSLQRLKASFVSFFTLVGDQTVYKNWSFNVNRFR